jgi:hypothetical protein
MNVVSCRVRVSVGSYCTALQCRPDYDPSGTSTLQCGDLYTSPQLAAVHIVSGCVKASVLLHILSGMREGQHGVITGPGNCAEGVLGQSGGVSCVMLQYHRQRGV